MAAALAVASSASCIDMMEAVKDVPQVEPITVSYKVSATTGFIPKGGAVTPDPNFSTKGVGVTFTNVKTAQVFRTITDENCIATVEIDPGVYSISISGTASYNGADYYINGHVQSISLFRNYSKADAETDSSLQLTVRPAKVGSLCFSEIYYCGVSPFYFRDQTYHIYNNGGETIYLDGICFAQLHPNVATANLPVWPDEDGSDNFVYGLFVWQFPGAGTDYPLEPGESVVLVQEARDHRENNPDSYDNSIAEWECWTGNVSRDNPDVANLPYIFYSGSLNTLQWLTSVFGAAFCLFKPEGDIIGEEFFANDGPNVQNEVGKTAKYAKIKADWIMDGVELVPNMSSLNMKRIPGFVDAGATSVGSTYCGMSVSRKVKGIRPDGTPIYQDTNNSTEDFQINEHPVIRRNSEKAPSWRPAVN